MIQYDNTGSIVASQTLCRERQLGVFYRSAAELAVALRDGESMGLVRKSVWEQR